MSVRLPYPVFIGLAASWFCSVVRRRVARAAAPDRRDCAAPSRGPAGPGRPGATFSAARLLSYAAGLPPGPDSCRYSRTSYVLAPMIVERVTHDIYADQLMRPIITPLRLQSLGYAPYTSPAAGAARQILLLSLPCRSPRGSTHRCPASRFPAGPDVGAGRPGHSELVAGHDNAGPRPAKARSCPGRRRQLESPVSVNSGQPIPGSALAAPAATGSASRRPRTG